MKNHGLRKKMGIGLVGLATFFALNKDTGLADQKEFIRPNQRQSKIEEFVKGFPVNLPGIQRVDKYLIPDSEYCLVHIRQIHYAYGIMMDEQICRRLNTHQKNIYDILNFFIEKRGLKHIRIEGLTDKNFNESPYLEIIEKYYKTSLREIFSKYGEDNLIFTPGGAKKLILDKKINPEPGERLPEYLSSISIVRLPIDEKLKMDYILDKREDAVLGLISTSNKKISWIVYGGDHAWGGKKSCGKEYNLDNRPDNKDNLYEWNKEHPKKRISLIEIIPKGYKECKDYISVLSTKEINYK